MRGSCYGVTRWEEYPCCEYQKDRISICGTRNLNGTKCSCCWIKQAIGRELAQSRHANSQRLHEGTPVEGHVKWWLKLSDVNENFICSTNLRKTKASNFKKIPSVVDEL
jgi:hypothetical protein